MDHGVTVDWAARALALAEQLSGSGVLDSDWVESFTHVPRHVFVPEVLREDGPTLTARDPEWLDTVYADEPLLTRTLPAGEGAGRHEVPTSSSSRPWVMAFMLNRLGYQPGQRILEIGTGTGYNTALLGHRLKPENVYSIDIDSSSIEAAHGRLAAIGQRPHLRSGDGTNGWPGAGPFDRIIATCAVSSVPSAWIDQLTDDGRIVIPFDGGSAGPLLVLDKTGVGEVSGWFDQTQVHFMPLRHSATDALGPGQSASFTGTGVPSYDTTALDPKALFRDGQSNHAFDFTDLALFLWFHAPTIRLTLADQLGSVYVHTADSLAQVEVTALESGLWPVQQRGPARLWDTVEHAYAVWVALGHPRSDRFGVTAQSGGEQFAWLDTPDGDYAWPLLPTNR